MIFPVGSPIGRQWARIRYSPCRAWHSGIVLAALLVVVSLGLLPAAQLTVQAGWPAVLVKDINQATASSAPHAFAVIGSLIYFSADDGIHGRTLWRSDGTVAGTSLVKATSGASWLTN